MEKEDLARARMAENPFVPLANAQPEWAQAHSLNYIAFYLGEIEKHLSKIAHSSETGGGIAQAIRDSTGAFLSKR
jgi:hypothetical protein